MLSMVFVVFLSVSMLGRRYSLTHYFAVVLIILGLSVVSFDSIFGTSEVDSSTGGQTDGPYVIILGMLAMVTGQFFHAAQSIYEEYILQGASKQEPCYMMGWEGIYGLIFTSLLMIPGSLMNCPFNESQCVNGHLEDLG
jgi:drug/metabolite transporter (DMT)-like permease